jgi:hypothetical protein
MTASKGYYSIIQYCPDAGRAEAANVGVVLFCPDLGFLDARVSQGNDRVSHFFGRDSFDRHRLNAVKHSVIKRLSVDRGRFQTPADLEQFIATRANEIRLTPPRPMRVTDPKQDLDALFNDLVGGRAQREPRQPVFPELDQALRQPSLQGRIRYDEAVTVPVLGKTLRCPYAFRNERDNLVKPHAFSEEESRATSAAAQLAVEGDLLQRHPDPERGERRFIVVPDFSPSLNGTVQRIVDLFAEYRIRLVRREQIPDFVAEIEQHAH